MATGEFADCYAREYLPLVRFVIKYGVSEQEAARAVPAVRTEDVQDGAA